MSLSLFRDTDKKFKLHGGLLKKIAIKNYTVDLAKLTDKNIV